MGCEQLNINDFINQLNKNIDKNKYSADINAGFLQLLTNYCNNHNQLYEDLNKLMELTDNSSDLNTINLSNIDLNNLGKYTPIMHQYDKSNNVEHFAFVSDFFPLNDIEIKTLIISVKRAIKTKLHTPAIDIYKYWILSLKNNNEEYYKYDFNNYNDKGEYLGQQSDTDTFDIYLSHIEDIITYDEAKALKEQARKDQEEAEAILKSGTYQSDVDPDINNYFK